MGSLIGTPPNALFAAHVGRRTGTEVGSLDWAMVGLTAAAWIARRAIERLLLWGDLSLKPPDASIGVIGGTNLFLLPSDIGKDELRLQGPDAMCGLRWDILALFCGCLAIATLVARSGFARWIGGQLVRLDALALVLLMAGLAASILFVGELASTTTMAAPIVGAAAMGLVSDPVAVPLTVALAAQAWVLRPVETEVVPVFWTDLRRC
ncbi:anion permease [Rhodovulum tesquicola]|nr:anion permease [Rhodovulum tesquicola]MCO8145442.1 anion permease [Rhodovulum tesquicola]